MRQHIHQAVSSLHIAIHCVSDTPSARSFAPAGRPLELIENETLRHKAFEPVMLLGRDKYAELDIRVRVKGGGHVSQTYAIRQSLAKAIVAFYQKCATQMLVQRCSGTCSGSVIQLCSASMQQCGCAGAWHAPDANSMQHNVQRARWQCGWMRCHAHGMPYRYLCKSFTAGTTYSLRRTVQMWTRPARRK